MYKNARNISVIILIAYVTFELLNVLKLNRVSAYIILAIFALYAFSYLNNVWYYYKKIGIYVFAVLIGHCFYEIQKLDLGDKNFIVLFINILNHSDRIIYLLWKYQILPIIIFKIMIAVFKIFDIFNARSYNKGIEKKLFESRNNNFEDLNKLLKFNNDIFSIGINAKYGSGKSFLIEKVKNRINDIRFIDIYSISANVDNIEKYIISELKIALNNCGIYINNLNVLINNINSIKFLEIFENQQSLTRNFNELKKQLMKCNRNFVFVVDDLDRIYNPEIIYKIFNIFEKIKCKNMKVLYLYDFECLSTIIPLKNSFANKNMIDTKKFLTKYISHEITLNEPTLDELKIINTNTTEYTSKVISEIQNIDNRFTEYKIPTNFISLTGCAPRDFEIISEYLKNVSEDIIKNFDESVIIETLIFKHFFVEEYNKIISSKQKLESLIDFYDTSIENISIQNLINDIKNKTILVNNKNATKRIKYISIFLIFNPNVNEYNFNNGSFGKRSDEFNRCIIAL